LANTAGKEIGMSGGAPGVGSGTGSNSAGAAGGTSGNAADLQAIFDKAAADRKEFTEISVKGNTEIAKFNEKPKI
jgi:hypothetical protein